ncbi:MAG: hypothetical protein HYU67_07925 [Flavobacteriia bacterium]|nr:hypothetical protein [Flavobacteriia bacterium]
MKITIQEIRDYLSKNELKFNQLMNPKKYYQKVSFKEDILTVEGFKKDGLSKYKRTIFVNEIIELYNKTEEYITRVEFEIHCSKSKDCPCGFTTILRIFEVLNFGHIVKDGRKYKLLKNK